MPLPVPHKGESDKDFLKRCMGDPVAVSDFKDASQRYAVCLKQSKIRSGDASASHPELPTTIHLEGSVTFTDSEE